MCGIVGILPRRADRQTINLSNAVASMNETISHRGPDDHGVWVCSNKKIALGHRRLSIIDTSESGHQPMTSESGKYVLVYNGEIYNYETLRNQLTPHRIKPWKGHSDTEVLLSAFEHWGVKSSLSKLDGMFAFGLWNRDDNSLILARDPIGEKPLYYQINRDSIEFASELKAFRKSQSNINQQALTEFLKYGYTSCEATILDRTKRVPPGCYLKFSSCTDYSQRTTRYWDILSIAESGLNAPLPNDEAAITKTLEDALDESVQSRMIADVAIGAFLSGGYDSSLVVATMSKFASSPVKTFSVGFESKDYNEADYAKEVSTHLGTDHHEIYLTSQEALKIIPQLSTTYCEPFADPSQIPTLAVSQFASSKVKTILSGDGGDELFFGYNRHIWAHSLEKLQKRHSIHAIRIAAKLIKKLPPSLISFIHRLSCPLLPNRYRTPQAADKILKVVRSIDAKGALEFYEKVTSSVDGSTFQDIEFSTKMAQFESQFGKTVTIALIDMIRYLPNDILTKVDRASMAASLEARVPLLSPKLIALSWRIPESLKIRNGSGKWILKEITHKHIPKNTMNRPKTGFSVPIAEWLRSPLKSWADDLLSPSNLKLQNDFDPKLYDRMWSEHKKRSRDHSKAIWNVLTYLEWKSSFKIS